MWSVSPQRPQPNTPPRPTLFAPTPAAAAAPTAASPLAESSQHTPLVSHPSNVSPRRTSALRYVSASPLNQTKEEAKPRSRIIQSFVTTDVITSAVVVGAPPTEKVWTAEEGGWLRVRNAVSGDIDQQHRFKSSRQAACLCAVHDAKTVWIGHADGTISVFSTATCSPLAELVLHQNAVTSLCRVPTVAGGSAGGTVGILSSSTDGRVCYWNHETMKCVWAARVSMNGVNGVSYDPKEGVLYAACADGTVRSVSSSKGEVLPGTFVCTGAGACRCVLVVPLVSGGSRLWAGGDDGRVTVWDLATKRAEPLAAHCDHKSAVRTLAFAEGEGHVWSTSGDSIVLYDVASMVRVQQNAANPSATRISVAPRPCSITCATSFGCARAWRTWTCTSDGTVRGWITLQPATESDLYPRAVVEPSFEITPPTVRALEVELEESKSRERQLRDDLRGKELTIHELRERVAALELRSNATSKSDEVLKATEDADRRMFEMRREHTSELDAFRGMCDSLRHQADELTVANEALKQQLADERTCNQAMLQRPLPRPATISPLWLEGLEMQCRDDLVALEVASRFTLANAAAYGASLGEGSTRLSQSRERDAAIIKSLREELDQTHKRVGSTAEDAQREAQRLRQELAVVHHDCDQQIAEGQRKMDALQAKLRTLEAEHARAEKRLQEDTESNTIAQRTLREELERARKINDTSVEDSKRELQRLSNEVQVRKRDQSAAEGAARQLREELSVQGKASSGNRRADFVEREKPARVSSCA